VTVVQVQTQAARAALTSVIARSDASLARLRRWLAEQELDAVVLATPAGVAWVSGGRNLPIDRTAGIDLVWAVVTASSAALITTDIEAPRVRDELAPESNGFEVLSVPWWYGDAFAARAREFAGDGARVVADAELDATAEIPVASDDLVELRLALSEAEQDDLRMLGHDAADALQQALLSWQPGETDHAVAGRVDGRLAATGADAPVLIVGGDERLEQYRHPLSVGAPMHRVVMAVVVARRGGLHVAATRFACVGPLTSTLTRSLQGARRVDDAALRASRPGATYGEVMTSLAAAYADVGSPQAWKEHYQGGPIGYAQREFELAPPQTDSRWWPTAIAAGHALAWNPSLTGGGKYEDTYLVSDSGLELVTGAAGWPVVPSDAGSPLTHRPAVLDVESGEPARGSDT
jgi:Xaa-Pro dipeptidase